MQHTPSQRQVRRQWRRPTSIAWALGIIGALGACGSDPPTERVGPGQVCATHDDCQTALMCIDQICRALCQTPVDCDGGLGCRDGVCRDCQYGVECAGGYGCDSGSGTCLQACDADTMCQPTYWCDTTRRCQPRLPNGGACDRQRQCASERCVDAVCCDDACTDLCHGCRASYTGGNDGACAPIQVGLDPLEQCSRACDGAGACQVGDDGEPCLNGAECGSGFCSEWVCCQTPCTLSCYSCAQPGFEGDCLPDTDLCATLPLPEALDGTAEALPIAPRAEHQAAWDAASDRVAAARRVPSSGAAAQLQLDLLGATALGAVYADKQDGGSCHISFEILDQDLIPTTGGKDMLRAMLRFGTISGTAAAGLFLMTLMADTGTGHAQVFFLQGQDGADGDSVFTCAGGTCTTNSNIVISGELQTNAVTANGLTTVDELIVRRTHTLPACPEGYEQDDSQSDITVCARGLDEMVRVGNVWIDRYESLIVDGDYWDEGRCLGAAGSQVTDLYPAPAFFPDTGDWTLPLYACSVPGVTPSHSLTYYQAQAACALAGKRLCLNEEWQAAAQGTVDPGSNNGLANTQCNTNSAGIRNTGLAGSLAGDSNSCISRWGAEDMIGNMSEIVSTIFGHPGSNGIVNSMLPAYGSDGYVGGGPRASSMPAAGTDNSWRARNPAFLGQADGATDPVSPAIALRGGMHQQSTRAGTFAMDLSAGPAHFHTTIGFRCCRGR